MRVPLGQLRTSPTFFGAIPGPVNYALPQHPAFIQQAHMELNKRKRDEGMIPLPAGSYPEGFSFSHTFAAQQGVRPPPSTQPTMHFPQASAVPHFPHSSPQMAAEAMMHGFPFDSSADQHAHSTVFPFTSMQQHHMSNLYSSVSNEGPSGFNFPYPRAPSPVLNSNFMMPLTSSSSVNLLPPMSRSDKPLVDHEMLQMQQNVVISQMKKDGKSPLIMNK